MPFPLTLTLEKSKVIPSCEAFFCQDSACGIFFETTKLKVVQKLLYKFEKTKMSTKVLNVTFSKHF